MASDRCGAACAPSHTTTAPTLRAIALSAATSLIVPIAFEMCGKATTFVFGTDERREMVDVDAAIARDAGDAQRRAFLDGELLPGDEVGVVLEPRDDDLVAGAHVGASPRRGDEVERFGRAAREDEPVGVLHAHEPRDAQPGVVIAFRRARRERIGAAMRIGVVVLVVLDASRRARRAASATSPPSPGSGGRIRGEQREILAVDDHAPSPGPPPFGVRRDDRHSRRALDSSAACSACQARLAHFTRSGNFAHAAQRAQRAERLALVSRGACP